MMHGLGCPAARGIFPQSGIEFESPAVAGVFSTLEPPGTPSPLYLLKELDCFSCRNFAHCIICGVFNISLSSVFPVSLWLYLEGSIS